MGFNDLYDVEKQPHSSSDGSPDNLEKRNGSFMAEDGAVPGETFEYGDSMRAKLMRLAGKLNIEQRGIERVPEDERTDAGFKALLNTATMVSDAFISRAGHTIANMGHSGCLQTWSSRLLPSACLRITSSTLVPRMPCSLCCSSISSASRLCATFQHSAQSLACKLARETCNPSLLLTIVSQASDGPLPFLVWLVGR